MSNVIKIDSHLFYCSVDTEAWLDATLDRVSAFEKLLEDNDLDLYEEQECAEFLAEQTGLKVITSDNTYNSENDLDRGINFTIVSDSDDWFYGLTYIVLRIHRGGDIRGNYSNVMVYKVDPDRIHYFFDGMCLGIRFDSASDLAECDHYTPPYRGYSLYAFSEDFTIYGIRPDGTILCKNNETNKRYKAYLESSVDFC